MMTVRKPLIAAIVAIVLFAAYLLDRQATVNSTKAAALAARILDFDETTATHVRLENEHGTFVLEKRAEGEWWLTEPVELRADPAQARALIDNIRGAKKLTTFEASDLSEYGLDDPSPVVTVKGVSPDGQERSVTLELGGDSAQIQRVYGRLAGEDEVFLVGSWVRNQAQKDLAVLRDKQLLRFPPVEVERLVLALRDQPPMTLERRPDDARQPWWIAEQNIPADEERIRRVLGVLSSAGALSVEDSPSSSSAQLGFDDPLLTVTVDTLDGETQELLLGAKVPGEDRFFARSTEQKQLAIVRGGAIAEALTPPMEWVSRDFQWTAADHLTRISTSSGTTSMTLVRAEDGQWQFADKPDLPIHRGRLAAFLRALEETRAAKLVARSADSPEDLARFGLTYPTLRVELAGEAGRVEGLALGKMDPLEGAAYVQRLQDGVVALVPAAAPKDLHVFRADLMDKRLREPFAGQVVEIVFASQADQARVLQERGVWKLRYADGTSRTLPETAVLQFLETAQELEPESEIVTGRAGAARWTIEFKNADGETFHFLKNVEGPGGTPLLVTPDGFYQLAEATWANLMRAMEGMIRSE